MWVIFDLNGTLLDPAVLLDPPELPIAALDEANMMAMITVIAGAETTFKPLFDAALRRHLERAGRDPDEAGGALEKLARMPAFPEVPDALQTLRDGGCRLAVLTQSAVEPSEAALTNAGHPRALRARPLRAGVQAPSSPRTSPTTRRSRSSARPRRGSSPATGGTSRAPPTRA